MVLYDFGDLFIEARADGEGDLDLFVLDLAGDIGTFERAFFIVREGRTIVGHTTRGGRIGQWKVCVANFGKTKQYLESGYECESGNFSAIRRAQCGDSADVKLLVSAHRDTSECRSTNQGGVGSSENGPRTY